MEEKEQCEYCSEPATATRKVYFSDLGCLDIPVCAECASYIDEREPYTEPEQYE